MNTNLTAVKTIINTYNDIITYPKNQSYLYVKRTDAGVITHLLDIKYHIIGNYYMVVTYFNDHYTEFKMSGSGFDIICNMVDGHNVTVQLKVNHINKVIGETEGIVNNVIRNRQIGVLKSIIFDEDECIEGLSDEFISDVKKYISFDYRKYSAYLDKVKMMKNILSLLK